MICAKLLAITQGCSIPVREDPLLLVECSETMDQSQKDFALAVVSVGWPASDNISSCCVQRVLELRALISCMGKVLF